MGRFRLYIEKLKICNISQIVTYLEAGYKTADVYLHSVGMGILTGFRAYCIIIVRYVKVVVKSVRMTKEIVEG